MEVIKVRDWPHLASLVAESERDHSRIYRGVTKRRHALLPKIGRPGTRRDFKSGEPQPYDAQFERELVTFFRRIAHPYLREEPQHELEWLAIMQHHGVPTRLLDWTYSPLIATFFAATKMGTGEPAGEAAAVFSCPVPPAVAREHEQSPLNQGREVFTYMPRHVSPRMQSQMSVLTMHQQPDEEWKPDKLACWEIPAELCGTFKLILDRCGINRASLFPDLQGVSEYAAWVHKWSRFPASGTDAT